MTAATQGANKDMNNTATKFLAELSAAQGITQGMKEVVSSFVQAAEHIGKHGKKQEEKHISGVLDFSIWIEETKDLPRHIREEFEETGFIVRVLKYADRYEVRYCRNGYNICASHRDLRHAKALFIEQAKQTKEWGTEKCQQES